MTINPKFITMKLFFKMSFVKFLLILAIGGAHGYAFFDAANRPECGNACPEQLSFIQKNLHIVVYSLAPSEYLNSILAKYTETLPRQIMTPLTYSTYILVFLGFIFLWYIIASFILLPFKLIRRAFKQSVPELAEPAVD
jgi:hypothetical protein